MPTSTPLSDSIPDKPSKILNVSSFFCPPVGQIVYLSLVGRMPRQALAAGLSAAKGVTTILSLLVLFGIGAFVMWLADDVLNLFATPANTEDTTVTTKPPTPPRWSTPPGRRCFIRASIISDDRHWIKSLECR